MREFIWRVKRMLWPARTIVEKRDELQFHLDMEVEAGLRRGLSPEDARRRARWRAGTGVGRHGVDAGGARHPLDRRHGGRSPSRGPRADRNRSFGTVAVLVLAATVAVNTLIFFMLDGVVLRALPYDSPERLVRLYDASPSLSEVPHVIGHYLDYRTNASSLQAIALYTGMDMELAAAAGRSKRLTGVAITSGTSPSSAGRP